MRGRIRRLGGAVVGVMLLAGCAGDSERSPAPTATDAAASAPGSVDGATAGERERTTASPADAVLPGLTSGGLTTALEQRDLRCDGPRPERTIASWRCTDGRHHIEFLGSPSRIAYLTATADASSATGRNFLAFMATTPYDGAEPDRARAWAEQHVRRDFAETEIGGVLVRVSGPAALRSLSLMRPDSEWAR